MSKKTNISFYGKKVLILGSGGTSKTVSCVVQESNAKEIVIVSRNGENNYQNIEKHYDSDIIINTTPVGMYPNNDGIPVDIAHFLHLNGVIDVIYNPIKTNLLLAAQRKNINYINGLSMLVAQAWFSHKLFFDIDCNDTEDIEVIENILQKIEKMFRNIVLIGMPGCGKTTIGKALAERLGVKFVDTDSKIETIIGKSPAELIETNGEEYFRKIESEIILKTAKETGQVIATGGGSVLLPQNRDALMQNGFIIYLDREIEKLATDNRPLSKNIDALYKERAPVYNALCSIKINVNDNLEDNIKRITELLK
ncbi:MAG: AAA family ATPase [Oscillospiraceae bacterium]|nr:AAA family ATPase [Oscillospiraceae bacterium]